MATAATILHADLDCFYASVEQLLDPSLRGKPIAVGGGVVLAASYEAKVLGVRSGMPGRQARQLCPQLIFVDGHFKDYQRLGDATIAVLNEFTPLVERISIDEAFADVAGSTHLFGPPSDIASAIRRRVRDELGLPISVGVARTRHLAKIASQVASPMGPWLSIPTPSLTSFMTCQLSWCGAWALQPARVCPRSTCIPSGSWQSCQDSRSCPCLVMRQERSSQHWRRTAIHGKYGRIVGCSRPVLSRRSANNLRTSESTDPHCVILPTGLRPGFGRSPDRVEP
jgi:hypothetical protein